MEFLVISNGSDHSAHAASNGSDRSALSTHAPAATFQDGTLLYTPERFEAVEDTLTA
jgi:hypothetical protein